VLNQRTVAEIAFWEKMSGLGRRLAQRRAVGAAVGAALSRACGVRLREKEH
jgi:hypothetical protein